MDSILLEGLKVRARIGVYDWEHKVEQLLLVDLKLDTDLSAAIASDNLEDTVDYAELALKVQNLGTARHYQLIEHFAGVVADVALESARVQAVEVRVHKPGAVADAKGVSVQVRRSRSQ